MLIRHARKEDLNSIALLGTQFGHLMNYQKDPEVLSHFLGRIVVATKGGLRNEVVGYYHYVLSGDYDFEEQLRASKQMAPKIVDEAMTRDIRLLLVCMQGASHRDAFRGFIELFQTWIPEIWCYCSIKSHRSETYEELGFTFDPDEERAFFNLTKGDFSTYRLGRWKRAGVNPEG